MLASLTGNVKPGSILVKRLCNSQNFRNKSEPYQGFNLQSEPPILFLNHFRNAGK